MIPQIPQNGDLLYQKAWTGRFFGSHTRCPQLYLRLGNSLLTSSMEPENHSSRLQCIIYRAEGGQRAEGTWVWQKKRKGQPGIERRANQPNKATETERQSQAGLRLLGTRTAGRSQGFFRALKR